MNFSYQSCFVCFVVLKICKGYAGCNACHPLFLDAIINSVKGNNVNHNTLIRC